jgi:hypothetical protein
MLTAQMVRAQMLTKQDLASGLLDGNEALPLQAFEHRQHRHQWFATLTVMPAPVRDRYLNEGSQELSRRGSVIRFQLLVTRLGHGREHTATSIFAYPPLRALSLLP